MQQQLKHCINALRITEQLPEGEAKNAQIDIFFTEVSKLGIVIKTRISGDIRYRSFRNFNPSERLEIIVTVIQSEKSSMILIEANPVDVSFD